MTMTPTVGSLRQGGGKVTISHGGATYIQRDIRSTEPPPTEEGQQANSVTRETIFEHPLRQRDNFQKSPTKTEEGTEPAVHEHKGPHQSLHELPFWLGPSVQGDKGPNQSMAKSHQTDLEHNQLDTQTVGMCNSPLHMTSDSGCISKSKNFPTGHQCMCTRAHIRA